MKLYVDKHWGRKVWFVGLDAEKTMDRLWKENQYLIGTEQNPTLVREEEECFRLDPGGSQYTMIPFTPFEINGVKFEIQPHHANHVLWRMHNYIEDFEGVVRFILWRSFVILPKDLYDRLIKKLEEIEKSDEALHANITMSEINHEINKGKYSHYFNGPKGKTI